MVVDFIKVQPMMSTKISSPNKKVFSTVRPRPLSKPIQSMANQHQQIIVIPGNMLVGGNKQNGQATMEQVRSILKLASTSNQQNLQLKTVVTSTNAKSTTNILPSSVNTLTSSVVGVNKSPVVLPTLIKNTGNSAIIRPVIGTNKTAVVSPQQQKVQVASNSPRVISLKRPYSAITCASSDINEPNIVKLSGTTQFQVLPHIATEHIKIEEEDEDDDDMLGDQQSVRKRANLDHMSPEEKMMRRKLKNRVAAQNARDKKRVKMDDMEDRIKRLEDENKRILEQNQKLMEFNRRLTEQNERLTGNDSTQEPKTIIKVEPQTFEETDLSQNRVLYVPPMSPESLPRSPSPSSSISSTTMTHHQRLSSLDDESAISLNGSVSTDSSDVSSLVEQRSFAPAAGTRSTFGRGRDMQKSGNHHQQVIGSIYCSPIYDLSHDNSTTGNQQSVTTRQEDSDNNDAIHGAIRNSGLLQITTKEENESCSSVSSEGEGEGIATTDIDDSWLSDLMVMNTSTNSNNNNMDRQTLVEQGGSIFTPGCHDNANDVFDTESLMDKYLIQQNLQQQKEQQQHIKLHDTVDNEEFDAYFNELFPDLAI